MKKVFIIFLLGFPGLLMAQSSKKIWKSVKSLQTEKPEMSIESLHELDSLIGRYSRRVGSRKKVELLKQYASRTLDFINTKGHNCEVDSSLFQMLPLGQVGSGRPVTTPKYDRSNGQGEIARAIQSIGKYLEKLDSINELRLVRQSNQLSNLEANLCIIQLQLATIHQDMGAAYKNEQHRHCKKLKQDEIAATNAQQHAYHQLMGLMYRKRFK